MRVRGDLAGGDGIELGAHVCWSFDEVASFHAAALEFLREGLQRGQRVAYVTCEPPEDQRAHLTALGDLDELLQRGALELHSAFDVYAARPSSAAGAAVADYAAATQRALADGYRGLRVAAHASELLADPALRERQLGWECTVDRHMAAHPMAALCGYDRNATPPLLLADLERVHPASHVGPARTPFRVYHEDARTLAICGEVDVFATESFDRLLSVALRPGTVTRLDLGELEFIDHHGLHVLAAHRRRLADGGPGVSIVRMPQAARRLSELLELNL